MFSGVLGTASAPIHMVTVDQGDFKAKLWRIFLNYILPILILKAFMGKGGLLNGMPFGVLYRFTINTSSFNMLRQNLKLTLICFSYSYGIK